LAGASIKGEVDAMQLVTTLPQISKAGLKEGKRNRSGKSEENGRREGSVGKVGEWKDDS